VSKKRAATEDDSAGDIDALFQLALPDFTAARNALASRLKKAGRRDEAEAVKGLQKPPISAWTVNQLFWKHRAAFDRLIDAGQKFRAAQVAQLSGRSADIRGPLDARREALADLSKRAAQVLRDASHPPGPDVMRRVTTTLEALSTYGGLAGTPQPGRLSDDVDPPGFETLAALVPRVGDSGVTGPSRVLRFEHTPAKKTRGGGKKNPGDEAREREEERKARLAAVKEAVQSGEQALREARKLAEQAQIELKKAAARAKETERESREIAKEKAVIDRRYEKASEEAEAARQEARAIAERAEASAQAVEDAEVELEKAREELQTLSDA
jgi:hypothetical protein